MTTNDQRQPARARTTEPHRAHRRLRRPRTTSLVLAFTAALAQVWTAPWWLPKLNGLIAEVVATTAAALGASSGLEATTFWGRPLVYVAAAVFATPTAHLQGWLAIAALTAVVAVISRRPVAPIRYFLVLNAFLVAAAASYELVAGAPAAGSAAFFAQLAIGDAITMVLAPALVTVAAAMLPFTWSSRLALTLATFAAVGITAALRALLAVMVVHATGTIHLLALHILYGPPVTLFVVTSVLVWFIVQLGESLRARTSAETEVWSWT